MAKNIEQVITKLADRSLGREESSALLAEIAEGPLAWEMVFQRHSATFGTKVPEGYKGGQTLVGKVGQQEVQVLIPKEEEQAARALPYGGTLSLVGDFLEFDDFYRRVTLTSSLPKESSANKGTEASSEPEEETETASEPTIKAENVSVSEKDTPVEPEPVPEKEQPTIPQNNPPPSEPASSSPELGASETKASGSGAKPFVQENPTEKNDPSSSLEPEAPASKEATGEWAIFPTAKLPLPSGTPLTGKPVISSAEIIAELAQRANTSQGEASQAVDGFWNYVAKVKEHYKEYLSSHILVIPHFATFSFSYRRNKQGQLKFIIPSSKRPGHGKVPESEWVDQWSGKLGGLSIRRRISVCLSEETGLPLKTADRLLNQLLQLVKELYSAGATIHWAQRGTMRMALASNNKRSGYVFNPSAGFLRRLSVPDKPQQEWTPPTPKPATDWRTKVFGDPESEWEDAGRPLKRKAGPQNTKDSSRRNNEKPPMPAGQKTIMRASGCGCLLLPLIAAAIGSPQPMKFAILLGIAYVTLMVKQGLCHK